MQSNVFRQEVLKPKGIHVSQVIFMYKNYLGSWVSVLSFTMCHRYFSVSLMLQCDTEFMCHWYINV